MKIQNTFIALFAIILLVVLLYGLALSDHRLDLTDDDTLILKRNAIPLNDNDNLTNETTTTISITTADVNSTSTSEITSEAVSPTTNSSTDSTTPNTITTVTSSITTEPLTSSPTTTVPPETSTTITQSPTTRAPGRKFDGLSFFGGMILAVGLGALIYLVVRYLRRNNQLPYSNLR